MKKVLIEREKSDARIDSSEREEARPKVKILFLYGFFASGQCIPALALREAFEGWHNMIFCRWHGRQVKSIKFLPCKRPKGRAPQASEVRPVLCTIVYE